MKGVSIGKLAVIYQQSEVVELKKGCDNYDVLVNVIDCRGGAPKPMKKKKKRKKQKPKQMRRVVSEDLVEEESMPIEVNQFKVREYLGGKVQ